MFDLKKTNQIIFHLKFVHEWLTNCSIEVMSSLITLVKFKAK